MFLFFEIKVTLFSSFLCFHSTLLCISLLSLKFMASGYFSKSIYCCGIFWLYFNTPETINKVYIESEDGAKYLLIKISHGDYKEPRTYTETQEVVRRSLEISWPLGIKEREREELTGRFSSTSLINYVFTPISDFQVFIDEE